MTLSHKDRDQLIDRYATAPARLRTALGAVPEEARKWRPGEGEFSVHEIIVHCADSETNAAARIRYLMAEEAPLILGYDPDRWSARFDYRSHPLEAALVTIEAVRANTVPVIQRLSDADWAREGRHSESGRYSGEEWLRIYSSHLEEHIEQLNRTHAAWRAAQP